MYRYIVKFSNGKHRVGRMQSFAFCKAEMWELDRLARKMECRIETIDIWRCRK